MSYSAENEDSPRMKQKQLPPHWLAILLGAGIGRKDQKDLQQHPLKGMPFAGFYVPKKQPPLEDAGFWGPRKPLQLFFLLRFLEVENNHPAI